MSANPRPRETAARVTINDVAQRAGVSKAAVSLVFNDRPGVSEPTRRRIREAARELGWTPSQAARSLSAAEADTVGLVIARPPAQLGAEPFWMEFISGVESVLERHAASLLLRVVSDGAQEPEILRAWWQARKVAGAILVDLRVDDPRVAEAASLGMPVVVAGHPGLAGPLPAVWTDDAAAVREAVRYLAALGHRRVDRIGGPAHLGHSAIRAAALDGVAAELGLAPPRTLATDFSGEQGARATRSLLASGDRPTAIIYDNDLMAVAGLSVAAEMGLEVPRDISLLAWDDSQLCRLTRPQLSAMSHDVAALGAVVAQRFFDVLRRRPLPDGPAATPVLVPRGSTGRAPDGP